MGKAVGTSNRDPTVRRRRKGREKSLNFWGDERVRYTGKGLEGGSGGTLKGVERLTSRVSRPFWCRLESFVDVTLPDTQECGRAP